MAALIGNLVKDNYADHIDPDAERTELMDLGDKKNKSKKDKSKAKPLTYFSVSKKAAEKELKDFEAKKDWDIEVMSEDSSPKAKHNIQDFSLISNTFSTSLNEEVSKKRPFPVDIDIPEIEVSKKKIKESTSKGVKYVPEEQTNPWGMLLGLYHYQTTTNRKYAAKKEIKDSFVKVAQVRC